MRTNTRNFRLALASLVLLASILVLTTGAAVAGPQDYWPMFNRDLQNTGVADSALTGIATPVEMWSYTTDNEIGSGSPAIADIDGDGAPEVLVPTANFAGTGGIYALDGDGSLKWKYPTGDYGTYATPPLADIDGDGRLETIFPSYGGKIIAVDDDGNLMWVVDKGSAGTRSVIADMTDDAGLEVVAGAASKTFLLKASDGTQLWQADYRMLCDPAIADVDGDDKLEVVFSASGKVIVALNAEDGTVSWTSTPMGQDAQNNLSIIGDINGDGKPDVVAGARDKKVYVFSGADGTKLWDYGVIGRSFSAAVADFNGDGYDDVATTATKADGIESYVYLLDAKNRTLLWQHNIVGKGGYTTERSPSIADVNGDGTPDVLVAGLSQKLYALSGIDGSEIWTIDTNDPSAGVPALGDLDGDGGMEIVVAAGNSVQVFTELVLTVEVAIDIKPGSCLNPLNVKEKGVLPVAILGTSDFDVTQVDPELVTLEGVAPLRWSLEDVATPFEPFTGKEDAFNCTDEGPDGFLDLTLKFDAQETVAALGDVNDGDVLVLTLTGNLLEEFDGTPIQGEDVVVILEKGEK
jgi:outer membrane protein assembly factor BamB